MKKAVLLLTLLLIVINANARKWRSEFTFGYYWVNPLGDMRAKIDRADAMNMELYMISPNKRFAAGFEMCFAYYDPMKFPVEVNNSDVVTVRNARIDNSIANIFLSGRYFLKTEGPFLPYINMKAGISDFGTSLYVDGSEDEDCPGMNSEMLNCYETFAMSVGGGVKADLSYVFKKLPAQCLLLDFSCNYVGGGNVKYLSPRTRVNADDSEPVVPYDEYIKTDDGVVHVDKIGNWYHDKAEMLDFRVGISIRPSGWKCK